MDPTHLMNVTRKFEHQLKKNNNKALINVFTETPLGQEQPSGPVHAGSASHRGNANASATEDVPKATLYMAEGQEERKGGGKGAPKQYKMKAN